FVHTSRGTELSHTAFATSAVPSLLASSKTITDLIRSSSVFRCRARKVEPIVDDALWAGMSTAAPAASGFGAGSDCIIVIFSCAPVRQILLDHICRVIISGLGWRDFDVLHDRRQSVRICVSEDQISVAAETGRRQRACSS